MELGICIMWNFIITNTKVVFVDSMKITIPDRHCRGRDLRRPRSLVDRIKARMRLEKTKTDFYLPDQMDSIASKADVKA